MKFTEFIKGKMNFTCRLIPHVLIVLVSLTCTSILVNSRTTSADSSMFSVNDNNNNMLSIRNFPRSDNRNRYQETLGRSRNRCDRNFEIENGDRRFRERGSLVKFNCNNGYTLVGATIAVCLRDEWSEPIPYCVKSGCRRIVVPLHSFIRQSYGGGVVYFYCDDEYRLVGTDILTCDGMHWNGTEPLCEEINPPTTARTVPTTVKASEGTTLKLESWDDNNITINPSSRTTIGIGSTTISPQNSSRVASESNFTEGLRPAVMTTPIPSPNGGNSTENAHAFSHQSNITSVINSTAPIQEVVNVSNTPISDVPTPSVNFNTTGTQTTTPNSVTTGPAKTSTGNQTRVFPTTATVTPTLPRNAFVDMTNGTTKSLNSTNLATTATPMKPTSKASTTTTPVPIVQTTTKSPTTPLPIPSTPKMTIASTTPLITTKSPTTERATAATTKTVLTTLPIPPITTKKPITTTIIPTTKPTTKQTTLIVVTTTAKPTSTTRKVETTTSKPRTTTARPVAPPRPPSTTTRGILTTRKPTTTLGTTAKPKTTPIAPSPSTTTMQKVTTVKIGYPPWHWRTSKTEKVVTTQIPVRRDDGNTQDNIVPLVPHRYRPVDKRKNSVNEIIGNSEASKSSVTSHKHITFGHVMYIIGMIAMSLASTFAFSVIVLYCWRKNKGIARARSYDIDGRTLSAHDANEDFMWLENRDDGL